MSESLFPSGSWTGFYKYSGDAGRHRMDLQLASTDGNIGGDGQDDVGRFLIRGRYDAQEMECYWTKTYVGGHDVYYRGFREGKGIWGTWEIGLRGRGGFHIWPRALGEGEDESDAVEEHIPAEAEEARTLIQVPSTLVRLPSKFIWACSHFVRDLSWFICKRR